jgi:hypothetical protein
VGVAELREHRLPVLRAELVKHTAIQVLTGVSFA